jgi:hypothetical protein
MLGRQRSNDTPAENRREFGKLMTHDQTQHNRHTPLLNDDVPSLRGISLNISTDAIFTEWNIVRGTSAKSRRQILVVEGLEQVNNGRP